MVFPLLKPKIGEAAAVKAYTALYHEAVLVNLLEVCMFNGDAVESIDDYLVELIDYCYRKLVALNCKKIKPAQALDRKVEMEETVPQRLDRQKGKLDVEI